MENGAKAIDAVVDDGEQVVVDAAVDGGSGAEMLVEGYGNDGGAEGSGKGRVKGPWSPEEDVMLSRLVSKFGARNWGLIARGIPGRSGKSCRLRWCNQLDPGVKHKPFSGKFCCLFNLGSLSPFFRSNASFCADTLFVKSNVCALKQFFLSAFSSGCILVNV